MVRAGRAGASLQQPFRCFDGLLECRHGPVHLLLVHRFQDLPDARSWFQPQLEQVPPEQNWRGWAMLDAEPARALEKPVHRRTIELPGLPALAIGFRDTREQLEIDLVRESAKRAVADLIAHLEP